MLFTVLHLVFILGEVALGGAGDGNSNPRAAHQIIFVSWSARLSFPDVAKRRAIRKDRIGVIF